jgi:hypothetical protein
MQPIVEYKIVHLLAQLDAANVQVDLNIYSPPDLSARIPALLEDKNAPINLEDTYRAVNSLKVQQGSSGENVWVDMSPVMPCRWRKDPAFTRSFEQPAVGKRRLAAPDYE